MPKKKRLVASQKGIKNKRQGEIYSYFREELLKKDKAEKINLGYFNVKKEFVYDKSYETLSLNKIGRNYLLKKTAQAYREEISEAKRQILYWQENAGLTKIQSSNLVKKGQKIKLFFPAKGEHKEFWKKNKEFKQLWQEILGKRGRIKGQAKIAQLSRELYEKSPRRIRDRLPALTKQEPPKGFGIKEIYDKYVKNNYDSYTRKYYQRAIIDLSIRTAPRGELIADDELVLDKYGNLVLQEGQVFSTATDNRKPGRSWNVYKNVPSLEEVIKKEFHEAAQEGYIKEYGTELEIQTWNQKKDKALCWVEAILGESCSANQGTSGWWCLQCIMWGSYHIPQLPKHCPWKYTYKTYLCGTKKHSDANKQWHFSIQGEKTRGAIRGGDWGSCHIATYDHSKREKIKRK